MFEVSREIHFCYGHRLLEYPGKCRFLHGHNGRLVISFRSGVLDNLGMVIDLGRIKEVVGAWIDKHLDHRMILCRRDPVVPYLQQLDEPVFLIDENPTAENIARMIFERARSCDLPVTKVELWETPHCSAVYRDETSK